VWQTWHGPELSSFTYEELLDAPPPGPTAVESPVPFAK
jgi:hypothetical protein